MESERVGDRLGQYEVESKRGLVMCKENFSGKWERVGYRLGQHQAQSKGGQLESHLVWHNLVQSRRWVFQLNAILKLGPWGIIWNENTHSIGKSQQTHVIQRLINGLHLSKHYSVGKSGPPPPPKKKNNTPISLSTEPIKSLKIYMHKTTVTIFIHPATSMFL